MDFERGQDPIKAMGVEKIETTIAINKINF